MTQMLDERYGRSLSRRRRIVGWSVVAVGALALTSYVGWGVVARSIDAVDVSDTAFHVSDDRNVTISFQFTSPPGRSVACALQAFDEDHGVVGWRVVEYPAAEEHARAFTEDIPTVALATTGLVNTCWVT